MDEKKQVLVIQTIVPSRNSSPWLKPQLKSGGGVSKK